MGVATTRSFRIKIVFHNPVSVNSLRILRVHYSSISMRVAERGGVSRCVDSAGVSTNPTAMNHVCDSYRASSWHHTRLDYDGLKSILGPLPGEALFDAGGYDDQNKESYVAAEALCGVVSYRKKWG
jgi:hypothetical protein